VTGVTTGRRQPGSAEGEAYSPSGHGEGGGRAQTKWRRNGARAQALNGQIYKRPFARSRVTGSMTGTASRLKIQRATAKPTAA